MLYGYVLDNFDVTLKHSTGTADQSMSDMFHLTAGLLINLAHTSLPDLMHSSYLWERSRYNDKRTGPVPDYSYHRLFELHRQTLPPGSLTYKEDFCRWQFAMDLCTHGPEYFRKFLNKIRPPATIDKVPLFKTESIPLRSMEYHNSTVEGNLKAISGALQQTRVWNLEELMKSQMLPGLDETVIFFTVISALGSAYNRRRHIDRSKTHQESSLNFLSSFQAYFMSRWLAQMQSIECLFNRAVYTMLMGLCFPL